MSITPNVAKAIRMSVSLKAILTIVVMKFNIVSPVCCPLLHYNYTSCMMNLHEMRRAAAAAVHNIAARHTPAVVIARAVRERASCLAPKCCCVSIVYTRGVSCLALAASRSTLGLIYI